jgi:hypothetical protein
LEVRKEGKRGLEKKQKQKEEEEDTGEKSR